MPEQPSQPDALDAAWSDLEWLISMCCGTGARDDLVRDAHRYALAVFEATILAVASPRRASEVAALRDRLAGKSTAAPGR